MGRLGQPPLKAAQGLTCPSVRTLAISHPPTLLHVRAWKGEKAWRCEFESVEKCLWWGRQGPAWKALQGQGQC